MRPTTLYLAVALSLSPWMLGADRSANGAVALDRGASAVDATPRADRPADRDLMLYRMEPDAIEGSYRFAGSRLEFSGRRLDDEAAEIRLWTSDASFELESRILSRHEGWIRSGGVEISGRGDIDEDARRLLAELAGSVLGEQLARLPLEIGCRLSHRDASPLLAALVQPWQMVFKHTGERLADSRTLGLSRGCSYDAPRGGRLLVFGDSDAVAHVPFFNTLDAEGAALRGVTGASTAPCGAKCRGACGADCSSPLCSVKSSGCEYVCPTHSFCRFHDSCYDGCNATWGCWSPIAWVCKRDCDDRCLELYSSVTCAAWSQGLGPSDGSATYNECSGGGGGGGEDCLYAEVQVVREPGITVAEIERRSIVGEVRSFAAGRLGASPPPAGSAAEGVADRPPRTGWRPWGPDAVYAGVCDGGGGGQTCTDCSCQGEFTSWEGEVCGSTAEELVDQCWNSCW